MLNWFNRALGDHAPIVGALVVLVFILSAGLAYNFVRDFGVNNNNNSNDRSSEVRRDRQ
ncbi:hypothetical protein [Chamaesiphon polymorphus]|uniref:hypothetical protein n=1 Tax=Chamaesiphon polymorphus TaxID=2107691 RepID=UPI0015E76A86|nr:hypothetical protein [Chamaesiphon polymorphus]